MQRIIFLECLLLVLIVVPVNADNTTSPYIYYYSRLDGGIIIERADGTDSRLISGFIPTTHNSVIWRDWSPSGRWFALSSYYSTGEGGNYAQETQIISTDGQQQIQLEPLRFSSLYMKWAPHDDILLIVTTNWQDGSIRFQLFDVNEQTNLADTRLQYFGIDVPYRINLDWTVDGLSAYVSWDSHIVTLHRNGYTETRIEPNLGSWQSIRSSFHEGRLLYLYRVIVEESIVLRIEDIDGDDFIEIEDPFWGRPPNPYRISWNPALSHALLYARPCIGDNTCDGWLKLINWLTGEIKVIDPVLATLTNNDECLIYNDCFEIWSPNGNYVALTDNKVLYLLDVSTGFIKQLGAGRQITSFYWSSDERLYIFYADTPSLYHYNPLTDIETEIEVPHDTQTYDFYLSPEGEFYGLISSPPMIYDNTGNFVVQVIPHSHSTQASNLPWSYTWHEDSEWIMANYNISFAGGGVGPKASVLFNLDGTVRRELPTSGSAGFVPERAIPYLVTGQATSVKKEPIFTLPHTGRLIGVGWHPTDPDRLVTYSQEEGLVFWLLSEDEPIITNGVVPPTEFPSMFPIGMRLFWFPEQDIVAFLKRGMLYYLNDETEEITPIETIEYPTLVSSELGVFLGEMRIEVNLEPEENLKFRRILTSGRDGFIVSGSELTDFMSYIDVGTGEVTQLDVTGFMWAIDARNNIATSGSLYNCCISVISTETGEVIDEFYGTAYSLALSADGRRLATTSRELTSIWDMSEYLPDETR